MIGMRSRKVGKVKGVDVGAVLIVMVMLLLTPLLAAFNAFIGPYSVLPYVGMAALVVFFMLPLDLLLLLAFFAASVAAGLIDYFAHVQQAFWIPYLMGLLFALRALVEKARPLPFDVASQALVQIRTQNAAKLRSGVRGPRVVTMLVLLYLLTGLFATLIAAPSFGQIFVAAKNYLFMWGVMLVLVWCSLSEQSIQRLWTLVIAVACIQGPFVLYQRFFVASKRNDAAAWDAVVGTFGGNPESGGHSAAMALVLCLAMAALLWRSRERRLQPFWLVILMGSCLLPIVLAEVKAAFIWLALVFLLLFARQVLAQPAKAMLTLILGGGLLVGIGFVYKVTIYEARGGSQTLEQIYDKQVRYAFDPDSFSAEYGRLGRVASLKFWWQQHDAAANPLQFFIGHGLGSSRSSSALGLGDVARKYQVALDTTGASTLLWDVGLIGAFSFLSILICGGWIGIRLSRNEAVSPLGRETLFLSGVLLAMTALGVLYNRDAIDTPVVQFLVYFALGQILVAQHRASSSSVLAPYGAPSAKAVEGSSAQMVPPGARRMRANGG